MSVSISEVKETLKSMGLNPEKPASPVSHYLSLKSHDDLIYISGQLPFAKGRELAYTGKVPSQVSVEDACKGAQICAMNILLHLLSILDDNIEAIESCLRLEIFVNSDADFGQHSLIADAASDVIIKLLGERGKHSRFAVGVQALPLLAPVEISAVFAKRSG